MPKRKIRRNVADSYTKKLIRVSMFPKLAIFIH